MGGKPRRLAVSLKRHPVLEARLVPLKGTKLVYVLVCDKKLNYAEGRSRIAYIGTTKNGVSRVAQSVATRADEILKLHGVQRFEARLVTCRPRQRVKTWHKLERALILAFKEMYGEIPWCNVQGKNFVERDEFDYFAKSRIRRVLQDLA